MLAGLALLESSPYQGAARRARAKIAAVMDEAHRAPVQHVLESVGVILRAADTWLLIRWCRVRQAICGFRLERITGLEILDATATPRDPALLEADLARWPNRTLARADAASGGRPSGGAR